VSEPVRAHLRSVAGRLAEHVLPPHYPTCLGCGPNAPEGYHLSVRRDGDDAVVTEHVFEPRHSGAPGIAHGGAVATVVDDLLGFLLYAVRAPGVTRRLEVDYLRPVLVGTPYVVRGQVDSRDGRKVWVSCAATDPDGTVAFRAKGLFVLVDLAHFAVGSSSGDGSSPIAP
jgi:acyl-coenzyme A thioesterase PaaI-like protein